MMMPKISVIVPIYNAEKYLRQCLDTICGQTLKEIEIICVNDGSTDNSFFILQEYQNKDQRIRIINQQNAGSGIARNVGIDAAKGKYLSFLDADDFFELDMLRLAYDHIEKCAADVVIFDIFLYNNQTGIITEPEGFVNYKYLPAMDVFCWEDIQEEYRFNITTTGACDKLYRRKYIEKNVIRFPDLKRTEDLLFTIMANIKAKGICILKNRLTYYRINNPLSRNSGRMKFPLSVCDALVGLKEALEAEKILNVLEKSFMNFALPIILFDLDQINNPKVFQQTYHKIKTYYFKILGFNQLSSDSFYEVEVSQQYVFFMRYSSQECTNLKFNVFTKSWIALAVGYQFPYDQITKGSRIILYGAGDVGRSYYYMLKIDCYCEIILWVDENFQNMKNIITDPKKILSTEYDFILLAVRNKTTADSIKKDLSILGVDFNKVIWK